MKKKYNEKTSKLTQKIVLIAVLVALGVIISIVDKMISGVAFAFLPMAKLGLANIIILFGIYRFDFKDTLIMAILKSTLVGLIFGSITSFAIGFTGTILSFLAMYIFHKLCKEHMSMIGISVIGGFFHIVGQCLVIYFMYHLGDELALYGAILVLFSLLSSILVGYIAKKTIIYLDNYIK